MSIDPAVPPVPAFEFIEWIYPLSARARSLGGSMQEAYAAAGEAPAPVWNFITMARALEIWQVPIDAAPDVLFVTWFMSPVRQRRGWVAENAPGARRMAAYCADNLEPPGDEPDEHEYSHERAALNEPMVKDWLLAMLTALDTACELGDLPVLRAVVTRRTLAYAMELLALHGRAACIVWAIAEWRKAGADTADTETDADAASRALRAAVVESTSAGRFDCARLLLPLCLGPKDSQSLEWINLAAERGDVPMMQCLLAGGEAFSVWTCAYATASGDLSVLQWLRSVSCPWNKWTCVFAAMHGHTHVLTWAHDNGCPLDISITNKYAAAAHELKKLK